MDMGCSCVVCHDDFDRPIICNTRWVTSARREHLCIECRQTIKPGDSYEYVSGLWEAWKTFKTCEICQRIRDDVCCGGYEYGGLSAVLWEAFGLDYVTGETDEEDDDHIKNGGCP